MSNWAHQQLKIAAGGSVGVPTTPPVNKVAPPVPVQSPNQSEPANADAGASAQKAMPPPVSALLSKSAQPQDGYYAMNTSPRFLLQDLVKQAQASAMDRARIAKEAAHQMKSAADGMCEDDTKYKKGKEKDGCGGSKTGSAEEVTTDYAMKLASAIEFVLPQVSKLAAPQAPPPHLSEKIVEPGKGPGAMHVMESTVGGTTPGPGAQGKATSKNIPPTHTGMQSSTAAGPSTQIPNDINNPPGGKGEQTTAMPSGKGKTAEAVYASNVVLLRKMAAGEEMQAAPGKPHQMPGFIDASENVGDQLTDAIYSQKNKGSRGLMSGEQGLMQSARDRMSNAHGEMAQDAAWATQHPNLNIMRGALGGGAIGGLGGLGAGYLAGGGRGAAIGAGIGTLGGGALGAITIPDGVARQADADEYAKHMAMMQGDDPLRSALGYHGRQVDAFEGRRKNASAQPTLVDVFLATIKQAEDAINPANISAGPAVEPDATQSGQGTPPTPNGSQMVGSNESAINYTKQQAKAEPKRDMSAYVSEPALSSAHDNTLQQAFSHTGEAGVKMSSANAAMQVSAARTLLEKIAAAANNK